MIITLNGKPREISDDATIATLLRELKLNPETIIVERNGSAVPQNAYELIHLAASDRLELVRLVGGG